MILYTSCCVLFFFMGLERLVVGGGLLVSGVLNAVSLKFFCDYSVALSMAGETDPGPLLAGSAFGIAAVVIGGLAVYNSRPRIIEKVVERIIEREVECDLQKYVLTYSPKTHKPTAGEVPEGLMNDLKSVYSKCFVEKHMAEEHQVIILLPPEKALLLNRYDGILNICKTD